MRAARDRAGAAILVVATVLGVWVGLTAPDTSPVQDAVPVADAAPSAP